MLEGFYAEKGRFYYVGVVQGLGIQGKIKAKVDDLL